MAAGVFTGQVTANFSFQEMVSAGVTAPIKAPLAITQTTNYSTPGTLTGQINLVYAEVITFVASTPQTFDMQTWTDVFGNTLVFDRCREFVIQNQSLTAGWSIKLYASSSNGVIFLPPIANYLTIPPGGQLIIRDPVSAGGGNGYVVGSSTLNFTIDPGSNAVVVGIMAAGGTAA